MEKDIRIKRARIFIILRLFIVTFLLFLAHYVFKMEVLIFYYVIAAVCVLSFLYLSWLLYGKCLTLLMWLQILFDTFLETILVYYTGGIDSLFASIYVLSILSAGILIAPWSSFLVAGLSSVLFTGLVVLNHLRLVPRSFPAMDPSFHIDRDSLYLFYATYVRITIFFVVAILTNFMTGTILKLEGKIRLQERLAFLGDIASRIAHEIRNPLTAISSSVEVLMKDLRSVLSDKDLKLMTAVVDESERLKRIFGKILDYSRVDDLKIEKTFLNQLMDHVLLLFANSKEFDSRISVVKRYESKKNYAAVDPEHMIDVFSNVVRNAYEAMPNGGVLTVDMNRHAMGVEVTISDTGEGMKKEVLKTLFSPFRTTKKTGTGLGLAQAQKIVSLHGGRIEVSSEPGKGTHVRIFLKG